MTSCQLSIWQSNDVVEPVIVGAMPTNNLAAKKIRCFKLRTIVCIALKRQRDRGLNALASRNSVEPRG